MATCRPPPFPPIRGILHSVSQLHRLLRCTLFFFPLPLFAENQEKTENPALSNNETLL